MTHTTPHGTKQQETKHQGQFWDSVTSAAQDVVIREAQTLIESLIPTVSGRDVLDAGCGAGDYSAAFTRMGARSVTAFDVSAGSIRIALGKVQQHAAHFALASLHDLPFPANSFDVIWSWGVLHYVPDPTTAMHDIVRVLRPGGTAIIHTLRRGFWSSVELGTARILSRSPRWVQPVVLGTGEAVIPLLSRIITGKDPKEHTSKTIRQKLHERLFVPGNLTTFTPSDLTSGFSQNRSNVRVEEVRPPISDLLKRDMSITIAVRKD
jgi:ubiquinone/menaquinone biosynthesis C-methylase UbiE